MFTINSAEAGEQPNGRFSRSAYWVLTLFFGITGLVNGLFYHVLITDLFAYLVIMVNVFASVLVILSCFGKNPLFIRESREPADEQHACYLFPFPPHNLMPEARTDACRRIRYLFEPASAPGASARPYLSCSYCPSGLGIPPPGVGVPPAVDDEGAGLPFAIATA